MSVLLREQTPFLFPPEGGNKSTKYYLIALPFRGDGPPFGGSEGFYV